MVVSMVVNHAYYPMPHFYVTVHVSRHAYMYNIQFYNVLHINMWILTMILDPQKIICNFSSARIPKTHAMSCGLCWLRTVRRSRSGCRRCCNALLRPGALEGFGFFRRDGSLVIPFV